MAPLEGLESSSPAIPEYTVCDGVAEVPVTSPVAEAVVAVVVVVILYLLGLFAPQGFCARQLYWQSALLFGQALTQSLFCWVQMK